MFEKIKSDNAIKLAESIPIKVIKFLELEVAVDSRDAEITSKISEKCKELEELTRDAARRGLIIKICLDETESEILGVRINPMIMRSIIPLVEKPNDEPS